MSSEYFICKNCGKKVSYEAWGTKHRNHCPECLFSLHVDDNIGDRKSDCGGLMLPMAKIIKEDGEEMIVHKCQKCGKVRKNRVAGGDNIELVEKLKIVKNIDSV